MNDVLSLRELKYDLDLVKEDRYRIYYNSERNVAIFAVNYSSQESIDDVFNAISIGMYEQLIEFMNDHNNLIIYWTKTEGLTSDYDIYCDCNYQGDWNMIDLDEYLWTLVLDDHTAHGYKYTITKDGERKPFKHCMG